LKYVTSLGQCTINWLTRQWYVLYFMALVHMWTATLINSEVSWAVQTESQKGITTKTSFRFS